MVKRNPDIEKYIDSLTDKKKIVYRFMRNEYDELTSEGDIYAPEIHDSVVAKKANEKLGVSVIEAGEIYEEVEFGISEYLRKNN